MTVLERFTDTPPITREDLRVAPVTFDLYREIHKGIRAELFGVTGQAGSLDPADEAGRVALFGRVRALADLLESHAHHEDTIMQPAVEEYVPAVAEQVIADHEVLDRRMYGLVALGEAVATPERRLAATNCTSCTSASPRSPAATCSTSTSRSG